MIPHPLKDRLISITKILRRNFCFSLYFSVQIAFGAIDLMDLKNRVFHDYLDKCFIVFVNDILMYFDNEALHEEQLRKKLEIMRKNKMYAKFSKCKF